MWLASFSFVYNINADAAQFRKQFKMEIHSKHKIKNNIHKNGNKTEITAAHINETKII